MDRYHIVSHPSGDWEGLYKNGKLIDEGHSGMERILMSYLITEGVVDMDEFEADMDEDDPDMPEDLPKEA